MAANTDKFQYVGVPGTATTLASPGYSAGISTSINVGSTSNWPTASGVSFAIDQAELVNGVEVRIPGTYVEFTGVVTSGTTISSLDLNFGTDQNFPAGSTTRVYIPVSSTRENALVDGLLVSHDQDGTLKAGAVDNTAVLASNVVTTAKILDANVTASKLATGAVTTNKIDYSTMYLATGSMTAGAILTSGSTRATVTLPAFTSPKKLTITAIFEFNNAAGATGDLSGTILNGASILKENFWSPPAGSTFNTITIITEFTSATGGETINFSAARTNAPAALLSSRSTYIIKEC